MTEIEQMARRLCEAAGRDPDRKRKIWWWEISGNKRGNRKFCERWEPEWTAFTLQAMRMLAQ